MDKGPLVNEEIEGAARFLTEFNKRYPVESAFWLKEGEHHNWRLFVVSDKITDENFDRAIQEVSRITNKFQDPWFDVMQVRVLGDDKSLARAVADLRSRFPADKPVRFFGQTVD